jgi:hypothetical protein
VLYLLCAAALIHGGGAVGIKKALPPFHFLFNSGGARAQATCCTYFSFLLHKANIKLK